MKLSKVLPEVLLNVIGLLGADNSRNGWNLTKSPDGKFSLVIDIIPAKNERSSEVQHRSMPGLVSQQQDSTAIVLEIPPPKKKQKSAAQRRRARKRFQRWLEKRKSRPETDQLTEPRPEPVIVNQPTADPKVLEKASCVTKDKDEEPPKTVVLPQETFDRQQDDVTEQPLQELPHGQLMSTSETPVTSSDSDSELDFDGDFHDQEFCANCMRQSPDCALKRCTRCLLSYYCSVRCQRENWQDHKLACSVVSAKRKAAIGTIGYK